jgi:hypothetical protein
MYLSNWPHESTGRYCLSVMRSSIFVAAALVVLPITLAGQSTESLGDAARRLRAEKAHQSQSGGERRLPGPAVSSTAPAASAVHATREATSSESGGIDALPPDDFGNAIADLLGREQFDELDRVAANERRTRARFTGGGWKLRTYYIGLCGKCRQTIAGTTIEKNIEHLKHWIAAKPDSVTPRIALADNYLQYAWLARGDDYADMVDQSAWKVFEERLQLASETLDGAEKLKEKCPHWFLIKERIARAQGWELEKINEIVEKGSSFEPLYYYLYQEHAYTLQPKWDGQEGDSEKYAEEIADRIGGKQGAVIYYKIATTLHCTGCSESELAFKRMSWPRIQKGFAAVNELYGTSTSDLNELAHFATRAMDRGVAAKLFMEIGEDWDKGTWGTRRYFESSRGWALSPSEQDLAVWNKVLSDSREPGNRSYMERIASDLKSRNAAVIKQCTEQSNGKDFTFQVILKLDKDGNAEQLPVHPSSKFSDCLAPKITMSSIAPPPHPDFLVTLQFGTRQLINHPQGATLPESGR